jgi:hypothetical protein
LRLDPSLRTWTYTAFAALYVSGAIWLAADQLKDADGELWQAVAANMLMLHGITAMVALLLLGALIPLHMQRSWRAGRNRITGSIMIGLNAVLIATAAGLYYAGAEMLRNVMADVHIAVGLGLPLLILTHIVLGRRTRARDADDRSARALEIPGALRPLTFSEDRGSR